MKTIVLLLTPILLTQVSPAFAQSSKAGTNSEKYRSLETESAQTQKIRSAAILESKAQLEKSPNKKGAEAWLRQIGDKERVVNVVRMADGRALELKDRGLGKPTELNLVNADGFKKTILQSTPLLAFLDITASPDSSIASIVTIERGSIDHFLHVLIDLKKMTVFPERIPARSQDLVWISTTKFIVNHDNPKRTPITASYSLDQLKKPTLLENSRVSANGAGSVLMTEPTPKSVKIILLGVGENGIEIPDPSFMSVVSIQPEKIIYLSSGKKGQREVRQIIQDPATKKWISEVLVQESKEVIAGANALPGTAEIPRLLLVRSYYGAEQFITLVSEEGKTLARIAVPEFCSAGAVSWKVPGKVLTVRMTSNIVPSGEFFYNLATKRFSGTEPLDKMLTMNGTRFVSYVIPVPSVDGTLIPTRLTHLKNVPRGTKLPVIFSVYGGFASPSGIFPQYSPVDFDFIRKGGIIVGAAVRGGNEFGEEWHEAAILQNKVKTLEDVSSIAKYLVNNNITDASKIILTGGSNGGFVVSASDLMFPDAFGLIVDYNGVNDMLAKERLDEVFNVGWSSEYGNSNNPAHLPFMRVHSPLEQASKGIFPNFMVVNGRNDSRVHPAHSLKLYKALKDNNQRPSERYIRFVSIDHAGHFSYSLSYQDLVGWRTLADVWTAIYDQIGWKF